MAITTYVQNPLNIAYASSQANATSISQSTHSSNVSYTPNNYYGVPNFPLNFNNYCNQCCPPSNQSVMDPLITLSNNDGSYYPTNGGTYGGSPYYDDGISSVNNEVVTQAPSLASLIASVKAAGGKVVSGTGKVKGTGFASGTGTVTGTGTVYTSDGRVIQLNNQSWTGTGTFIGTGKASGTGVSGGFGKAKGKGVSF